MIQNGGRAKPRARHGRRIAIAPPAVLLLIYAGFIALGTILLRTPLASGNDLTWMDCFFTATSAVTVTGLAVVDTGTAFTMFGQAVIMILIQLGGLGLMTFAVLVLSLLGLPVGLPQRHLLKEDLRQTSLTDVTRLVRVIFRVVVACELAGAILLAFVFVPEFGAAKGAWFALFHSVSAFNNAGFGLLPDSLSRWAGDPLISFTIPALVIVGGLGYSVIADLWQTRGWKRLSLHSKIMLAGTVGLLLAGTVMIAGLEWTNPATLGGRPVIEKIEASWFQSAMTRTAGFNSIDLAGLNESTALFMMSLMWIGGGATSTAGGIKVTTFIVLMAATLTFFRPGSHLNLFGRRLGPDEVLKVLALTMMSMLIIIAGIFLVMLTYDGPFLDIAFEVTSAFATVGMSRGATPELDTFGRLVMIAIMFIGRVGPLTLGFFLATRVQPRVKYPAGEVLLG